MTNPLADAAGWTQADLDENARGRISEQQKTAIHARMRRMRNFVFIAMGIGAGFATIGAVVAGSRTGNYVPAIAGMAVAFVFMFLMWWLMTKLFFGRVMRDIDAGDVSKVEGQVDRLWVSWNNRGYSVWVGGTRYFSSNTAVGRAMRGVERVRLFVTPSRVVIAAEPI